MSNRFFQGGGENFSRGLAAIGYGPASKVSQIFGKVHWETLHLQAVT